MRVELQQKLKEVEREKAMITDEKRAMEAKKSNIVMQCKAVMKRLSQEEIDAIIKSFKDVKLNIFK